MNTGRAVSTVETLEDEFTVSTDEDEYDADYVVLATGADRSLAEDLGCDFPDEDLVDVMLRWKPAFPMLVQQAQWYLWPASVVMMPLSGPNCMLLVAPVSVTRSLG